MPGPAGVSSLVETRLLILYYHCTSVSCCSDDLVELLLWLDSQLSGNLSRISYRWCIHYSGSSIGLDEKYRIAWVRGLSMHAIPWLLSLPSSTTRTTKVQVEWNLIIQALPSWLRVLRCCDYCNSQRCIVASSLLSHARSTHWLIQLTLARMWAWRCTLHSVQWAGFVAVSQVLLCRVKCGHTSVINMTC